MNAARHIAISDIHGCPQSFKALLEKIELSRIDRLYLLGDYIDRGVDSKGVIDHIFWLKAQGYKVSCLKGNHEVMLLNSLESKASCKNWLQHGGQETLQSFGVSDPIAIPAQYLQFFEQLPCFFEYDRYIMAHAGLNFKAANPLRDEYSLIWIRHWYGDIDKDWLKGRIVIHGHTPTAGNIIQQQLNQLEEVPVVNIDGGCVYNRAGMGRLWAFDMSNQRLYAQDRIEIGFPR